MADRPAAGPSAVASVHASRFDVFLSHNSRDKPVVERIAEKLRRAGLEPWLDKWHLTPGGRWQEELAVGLASSSACAVFIGVADLGDWEREELGVAQNRAATDRDFRLFPVLLPGLPDPFQPSALPPFLSTRTWVDLRGGYEDSRALQILVNAVKGIPFGPETPIEPRSDVVPYRGLQTFDEAHAEFFFGREGDVQRLLEKLKASRFLAVVGPSGSGKSSLVRAGLVPALRRGALPGSEEWGVCVLQPGSHPLTLLAAQLLRLYPKETMQRTLDELGSDERTLHLAVALALAKDAPGKRVLWVVDQAEEVFTLCRDEHERGRFLDNLLYASSVPDGRSLVVLTLRADFYSFAAAYPELSQHLAEQQFLVSPLDEEGLRQAIEEPARRVGLELESGLVGTILDDVRREPGALPLLEHALLELWERRRGRMLTLEGYRESGGVERAIAQRADAIFAVFTPAQRAIARQTFLRLTQPGEGTEDTRRRAALSELATTRDESDDLEDVLRVLVDARMLTTSSDRDGRERWVDVSHEALIRGWPRLRSWIDEDRAGLLVHRRLTEAADEWQRLDRDPGLLDRGARLAEARDWCERNESALNDLEREFLAASVELEARERRAAGRRVRISIGGLLIALAAISAAAVVAVLQREEAIHQRQAAFSRELAADAISQLANDPELSILLAIEAVRRRALPQAVDALRESLSESHVRAVLRGHRGEVLTVAFSPDGRLVVTGGDDGTTRVWRAADGRLVATLGRQAGPVTSVAFSRDGLRVVTAAGGGAVRAYDVATRARTTIAQIRPRLGFGAALSRNGKLAVAVGGSSEARVIDLATRQTVAVLRVPFFKFGLLNSAGFSPDGKLVVTAGEDGSARIWRLPSGRQIAVFHSRTGSIDTAAFSPDGKRVVTAESAGLARVWQVATGNSITVLRGHLGRVNSASFSPDGKLILTASDDGTARIWQSGAELSVLRANLGSVNAAAFSPDGTRVVTANDDGTARIWKLDPTRRAEAVALIPGGGSLRDAAFSPDGKLVAVAGDKGTAAVLDLTTRKIAERAGHTGTVWDAAFSHNGTRLVTSGSDGRALVTELATGKQVAALGSGHDLYGAAFSPDDRLLVTAGFDGQPHIWDLATRKPVLVLSKDDGPVMGVAFSPNGKLIATADLDGTARVWDLATGEQVAALRGRCCSAPISSAAFSPDGQLVATAGDDGTVDVWDVAGRKKIAILRGNVGAVRGAVFSRDGKFVLAAGVDGTARVWDLRSERTLAVFQGSSAGLWSADFSPDGTHVLTAGLDRTVRIFSCEPCGSVDKLLDLARKRVTRELTPEEKCTYLHVS